MTQYYLNEIVTKFSKYHKDQEKWGKEWCDAADRYRNMADYCDKVYAEQLVKNMDQPMWKAEALAEVSPEYQEALQKRAKAEKEKNNTRLMHELAINGHDAFKSICSYSKAEMQL